MQWICPLRNLHLSKKHLQRETNIRDHYEGFQAEDKGCFLLRLGRGEKFKDVFLDFLIKGRTANAQDLTGSRFAALGLE